MKTDTTLAPPAAPSARTAGLMVLAGALVCLMATRPAAAMPTHAPATAPVSPRPVQRFSVRLRIRFEQQARGARQLAAAGSGRASADAVRDAVCVATDMYSRWNHQGLFEAAVLGLGHARLYTNPAQVRQVASDVDSIRAWAGRSRNPRATEAWLLELLC